jgi:RND family efflux transporter MFP subunit
MTPYNGGAMKRFLPLLLLAALTARADPFEHDCMIEARQAIEIRSPVEAVIEQVKVRRGDAVTRGQVLVELAAGPERAALNLAKSRAEASGEIKSAQARVDIAQKKADRALELFKQNFISANSRDEALAELQLATEELRRASENRQINELEAKRAGEVLAMRTIRSPLNGVVVEVLLKPGEFGAITFKDPIMRLAEIDPLHVEVVLPVSAYGRVKVKQRATVTPEAPVGGTYQTTVKVVDPVVDAASGTFGVRLELPNAKRLIPAGVRCKVRFQ